MQSEELRHALATRNRKTRFDMIWRLSKPKLICEADPPLDDQDDIANQKTQHAPRHGGCGNIQPEIRKEQLRLWAQYKARKGEDDEDISPDKKRISAEHALRIMRILSDETLEKLGMNLDFARPEWMILEALPVPPPPVRPSISVDGSGQGQRSEDDLTFKLVDIIRANQQVLRTEVDGTPDHIKLDHVDLLQYHIATYMDNSIAGQAPAQHKSGRPIKSIRARLKGKEGRLRQNLMGKRVDFSARTVITGDPNLSLDEVGVPRSIARNLTYPETVTPFNIDKLKKLVLNGPTEHPGARFIIRDNGERIDLKYHKRAGEVNLEFGWKVERHIVDGDVILFNRQPSLHKESMMGHRVRVMPYSTFRLNLSVTSPYNADFDGDEMNLHVPQSEESRAELANLCMVPLNIVSPQRNSPLMGIVQDTLCGIYKMCRRDVFLSREQVMNIMLWVPDWDGVIPQPALLKPRPRWTGKQIISMVLPPALNLERTEGKDDLERYFPLTDTGLLVTDGELMFGLFNKKQVGAGAGGIVHTIFNEFGHETALGFFNGAQTVVNYWLLHNGFSVGIGDTVPDEGTVRKIQAEVDKKKAEVHDITVSAYKEELEALPGMNVRATFESKVSAALNGARDAAGSVTEASLKDINNAIQMARSGSKGSTINISQMTAIVGQQSVEGKRIAFGFKFRTLPHFAKDDYSAASRGFVENSYLRGLTPTEFFFHAMAGREGLIDTAVKTAETGYIQRRLVKALEEVTVKYDGTVRDSRGNVVQFIYGEDGLDGQHIERQKVDIITMADDKFAARYQVDLLDSVKSVFKNRLEQEPQMRGDVDLQNMFDEEFDQLKRDRAFLRTMNFGVEDQLQLPLNIFRILNQATKTFKILKGSVTDLPARYALEKVKELLDRLVVVRGKDHISNEAQENATLLLKAQLRSYLAYKRLVTEFSLNRLAFDHVIGAVETRFIKAAAAPGEMVGVLAAQSIGEPATQMTLNTFHFTGISAKNVTLGVPRLKEILNVSANIRTPAMTVYQEPDKTGNQDSAKVLRSMVAHTNLRSVAETCELWYDPDITSTIIPEDQDMVESYFIIPEDAGDELSRHSRWLLRITLNRAKLLDKSLTIQDVANKMKSEYGKDLSVIFSDINADEQVVRVRIINNYDSKDDEDDRKEDDDILRRFMNEMLDHLTFHGVPGITRAYIGTNFRPQMRADGSLYSSKTADECKEFVLDTTGSALAKVLAVPGVDTTRTYTNKFTEVFEVFGIEATRSALIRELTQVLSFDGSYVNHRHLALLCDVMTARGYVMAVTRHGINRSDTGALMRCSFEQTVEILLEAAAAGELDDCTGVSENLILGQVAPVGTGAMDIFLDPKMLEQVIANNSRLGLMGGVGVKATAQLTDGAATPYDSASPMADNGYLGSPDYGAAFSPIANTGSETPGGFTEYGHQQHAGFGGAGGSSPYGGMHSPGGYSPGSPFGGTSPTSPGYSPTTGGYSPASPSFGMTSPGFGPTSPSFSPSSPAFTPTSPQYSPTSPSYGQAGPSPTSPSYSPTSPNYSPTSPAMGTPTSPNYSPTSPAFSPTSPTSPTSPVYSPTSPVYSPTSPAYGGGGGGGARAGVNRTSPTSPIYSPTSPSFSPTSPTSPTSPVYSPTSPLYNHSPRSPAAPGSSNTPTSPVYSPNSPEYSPT